MRNQQKVVEAPVEAWAGARWEYRVELVEISGPWNQTPLQEQEVLDRMGANGWECFHAVSVRTFVGKPELRMYFKRPSRA